MQEDGLKIIDECNFDLIDQSFLRDYRERYDWSEYQNKNDWWKYGIQETLQGERWNKVRNLGEFNSEI